MNILHTHTDTHTETHIHTFTHTTHIYMHGHHTHIQTQAMGADLRLEIKRQGKIVLRCTGWNLLFGRKMGEMERVN